MKASKFIHLTLVIPAVLAWQCLAVYSQLNDKRAFLAKGATELDAAKARVQSIGEQARNTERQLSSTEELLRFRSSMDKDWTQALAGDIARIRAERAKASVRERQPNPPSGLFLELMDNPEYAALYSASMQDHFRELFSRHLEGFDEQTKDKVLRLLADRYMILHDIKGMKLRSGAKNVDGLNGAESTALLTEHAAINGQLKELLGAEKAAALINEKSPTMIPVGTNGRAALQLQTRLSYSEAPLNKTQYEALRAILIAEETSYQNTPPQYSEHTVNGKTIRRMTALPPRGPTYSESLLTKAAEILDARQMEGLRELQTEEQADIRRRQLPKS